MTSASKKIYLISGAFGLGIILIMGLVVVPFIRQIGSDSQSLFQKKQAIESFFQNWQNLENSKKDYEKIQKELQNKPALLTGTEAIKFIQMVEDFAQQTKNYQTISVLSQTPASQTVKDKTIDFQISLRGNFPNLIRFLIYLENAPYYNNIASLQINRLTAGSAEPLKDSVSLPAGSINSIITLSVYESP